MRRSLIAAIAVLGLRHRSLRRRRNLVRDTADTTASTTADTTAEHDRRPPMPHRPVEESCATGKTITDGVLTIATGEPAFPPYVVDNDPDQQARLRGGRGLGRRRRDGLRRRFGHVGPHHLRRGDPAGRQELRLQPPAVLDHPGASRRRSRSPIRTTPATRRSSGWSARPPRGRRRSTISRTSSSGYRPARRASQFVTDVIQPNQETFVYDDNVGAKAALEANQIDAIVVDLPTAFYISAVEIEGSRRDRPVPGVAPAAPPTSSVSCSRRTTRWSTASTTHSPRSRRPVNSIRSPSSGWPTEMGAPVIAVG